jgi:hypothetical protein
MGKEKNITYEQIRKEELVEQCKSWIDILSDEDIKNMNKSSELIDNFIIYLDSDYHLSTIERRFIEETIEDLLLEVK